MLWGGTAPLPPVLRMKRGWEVERTKDHPSLHKDTLLLIHLYNAKTTSVICSIVLNRRYVCLA